MSTRMRPAVLLLGAFLASCAYHSPDAPTPVTVPPSTTPASLRVLSASRTDGRIDVTAEVLTAAFNVVPSVPVVFTTSAGTFSPATVLTDTNGMAHSILATTDPNDAVTITAAGMATTVTMFAPQPLPPSVPGAPPTPTPPAPYFVNISVAAAGTIGVPMGFSVGTSAPVGTTWFWNFGDGVTAQTSTGATSHTYLAPGVYTASVNGAGTATGTASITVSNPVVAPTPPQTTPLLAATIGCSATNPTLCNAAATIGGAPIDSSNLLVGWDWGDGSGTTALSPTGAHPYPQAGTYLIVAHVTANAQTVTVAQSVVIP